MFPVLSRLCSSALVALAVLILIGFAPASSSTATQPVLGFHLARGDSAHMQAARAAGGQFVIKVFSWADIEPEPNYLYWEVPDAAVRAAEFYGLQVVARLDQPPSWASDKNGPTPWRLDAYANFVRQVVERYGDRLAGVIIWNEPNLLLEWHNQPPDPAAYVEMLKAAYKVVKAASPDMPVLLAGLAFTNDDVSNFNDLDYLQQIYEAGGGAYFDILAAHPYGFGRLPTDPPDPSRLNFRRLELHRRIMEANGDVHKPVWITEMGWLTRAANPADAWQVVTPTQQADYVQQALNYAGQSYPWLERLALWELNAAGDDYGYALWHGPADVSPAYQALVAACESHRRACGADPTTRPASNTTLPITVPILAPDVTIRLGDRSTLHPHWVHLHRDGQNFSPAWQGEFFLTTAQAEQKYDLLLEVMQVDQPTNRLVVNESELGYLQARTRPDPTSTWVTQRFSVLAQLLQPGVNTLKLVVGQRNPAHQYGFWRWENMQFRHARLVPAQARSEPPINEWSVLATPGGWSETNRLQAGLDSDFWLTGNRQGDLWRGMAESGRVDHQAGNRPDLLFIDVLPTRQGQLVATDRGLFWRNQEDSTWQPVSGAPADYAYRVVEAGGDFYAGFEGQGVWRALHPYGPWERNGLGARTILDLVADPTSKRLYAATDAGLFVQEDGDRAMWQPLPGLPGEAENSLLRFATRLYLGQNGTLVVRSLDRLWRWSQTEPAAAVNGVWHSFGPPELNQANAIQAVLDCCETGAVVATRFMGLWQLTDNENWQRLDSDNTFSVTDATELLRLDGKLYAAGSIGLFASNDRGQTWGKTDGLPATVSDLLIDPAQPSRWIAGTPAGVYRSPDRGRTWQAISPPWTIWDMAMTSDGRLFVARTSGVAWTEDLEAGPVQWHEADGLSRVLFFSVNPHPTDPAILWAGTWGNDIGVSHDAGQTLGSLGNGLETLSVLDILWHPTPGQVTVATIEGLYRSDDGGQSWFRLPGPLMRQTVYHLLQTDGGVIWAAAADGLWASFDYGTTWTRAEGMPIATTLRLGKITAASGNIWLWAGAEGRGLWFSADDGHSWQQAGLDGHSVYALLPDPGPPSRLVAATEDGILVTEFNELLVKAENPYE
jgi:photosystem II stability/assembly factor-like uncharacterized protein